MRVQIEDQQILLGGKALAYYPYYFAIWGTDRKNLSDHRQIVKSVLTQWATALASLNKDGCAVYLPYYLNDQSCKYLKAELAGEDVVLTDIFVWADGFAMNLDDLSREMYSEPRVKARCPNINGHRYDREPRFFGRYKAERLIAALRDAEIAA